MTDYSELQKRCQRGATKLNDANNMLAECYGMLGKLGAESEALSKDAGRYRRMRAVTLNQVDDTPDEFDAEFDKQLEAAMSKEG